MSAVEWPGVLAQWRLAANDLSEAPSDALHSHLFGGNGSVSFYQSYGGLCSAARNGTALLYVRIYKSGNEVLCDSLRSVDDGSFPPALAFLAVDASSARFNDPTNAHGVTADARVGTIC